MIEVHWFVVALTAFLLFTVGHALGAAAESKLTKVYEEACRNWERRYFELSEDTRRMLQGLPPVAEESEDWGSYTLDNQTEVEIEASRNQRHVAGEIRLDE